MGNKIAKMFILIFWAILAIFLAPVVFPLIIVPGNAFMTTVFGVVMIAFLIIFPIALIFHKGED